MVHDNLAFLTVSHSAIAAKKRAKHAQIREIVFDEDARRSFLTGFHKRKVARCEQAKKKAQLREKQERLETRREHRRALAERAARNAAEVERAYGAIADGDSDEWDGVSKEIEEEAYEGEEQLATVTVVQDFDISTLLHGPPPTRERVERCGEVKRTDLRRKKGAKAKYEAKAARRAEQRKQRARRTEKAQRARK